jgi:N-acetylglucosamine kinase
MTTNNNMKLAIDIGATKIAFGLFDGGSQPNHYQEVATPTESWDEFQQVVIANTSGGDVSNDTFEEVGVSVGGMVNPADQVVSCANIPAISGRNLGRDLAQLLGRPVFLRNDAECLALAESRFGVGRDYRQVFAVILGSGIGGAISVNDRLMSGATGRMGEWGHGNLLDAWVDKFSLKSRTCGCGRRNCLDLFGAGLGMSNIHSDQFGVEQSAREILAAWHDDSSEATKTVEIFLTMVSEQLALAINIIDPDIVPVAGGLSNDQRLIERIDTMVRARTIGKTSEALVIPAQHQEHGCLLGASLLDSITAAQ